MDVKLLEMTQNPVDVIFSGARQCYSAGFVGDNYPPREDCETKIKLIKHVYNSGHHSVLEHVTFVFAINNVSRALAQQLTRHRLASYSMQSQRYCTKNIFNSSVEIPPSIIQNKEVFDEFTDLVNLVYEKYNTWTEKHNIPGEDARYILPIGQHSRVVMTMNCRELLHFFSERLCKTAQWEIRNLAKEMLKICKEKLPVIFEEFGPKCKQLGYCPESKSRSCGLYPLKLDLVNGYLENNKNKKSNKNSLFEKFILLFKKIFI